MTSNTTTLRPQVGPQVVEIEHRKPAFRGLDFLVREVAAHISIPVQRSEIDWRTIMRKEFGWVPHENQEKVLDAIFTERKKVVVVRASKRGGKTQTAIAAAKTIHTARTDARGWCASKTYDLADRVFDHMWPPLTSGKLGEVQDKSRKDRRVRLVGGGLCQAKSWDDPDAIEGESLDYGILDEAQTLDQQRFDLFMARTLDRGGFLLLIGSPAADDTWFLGLCDLAQMNPNWAYFEWDIYGNKYIPPAEIQELKESMDAEAFKEYFLLQTRVSKGLVFGDVYDPEHNRFKHEPIKGFPMEVWIDPGTTSSAYAVAFVQVVEGPIPEVKVYDCIYMHNTFTEQVILKCKQHNYWHLVQSGVMDVAGRQHHDRPESPKTLWQKLARIPIYDQMVPEQAGIDRHKTFLYQPDTGLRRMKIHLRCEMLHFEYMHWRWQERRATSGEARRPINAFNHLLKAISYGLVRHFGYFDKRKGGSKNRMV